MGNITFLILGCVNIDGIHYNTKTDNVSFGICYILCTMSSIFAYKVTYSEKKIIYVIVTSNKNIYVIYCYIMNTKEHCPG